MWSFELGSGIVFDGASAGGELCSKRVRKNEDELSLAGGEGAVDRFDVALWGEVAVEMKLTREDASPDARGTTEMDEWSSCPVSILCRGWFSVEFVERLLEMLRRLGVE